MSGEDVEGILDALSGLPATAVVLLSIAIIIFLLGKFGLGTLVKDIKSNVEADAVRDYQHRLMWDQYKRDHMK